MTCAICPAFSLCGRAPDVLRPRPLRPLADVELDRVSLAQIIEAFAIDSALMEEVVLAPIVLDKAESLIDADCSNRSSHSQSSYLFLCLTSRGRLPSALAADDGAGRGSDSSRARPAATSCE